MKDTWTRGASNSQGPGTWLRHDWQTQMVREAQVDTWKLQGLS